jgi:hypothetical protein
MPTTALYGGIVAVVAVIGATVAVSLGKITGEAYIAIVGAFGGAGAGAAAHSAGSSASGGGA